MDVVKKLFVEHTRIVESGVSAENHMMFFWQLVNTELWLSHVSGSERRER